MKDIQKTISQKVWLWTLYIKWYIEWINFEKYKEMYERYQYIMWWIEYNKKSIWDFSENFNKLIDNFRENWFNKDFPIIVTKELIPIDWHHRIACCLYFNKTPKYKINNSISIKNYNWLDWILNNKFIYNSYSIKEKIEIINEYSKYNKIYLYYTNSLKNNKSIKFLWKIKINLKNTIYNVSIIDKEIKYLEKENKKLNDLFNNKKLNDLVIEKSMFSRKINIYFYHIINKTKRIIFEFIKNNLKKWKI
jgi:hypothetical protein